MTHDTTTHTLAGVLTRLREGGDLADPTTRAGDPDLEMRLNRAFAKHEVALRRFCRRELRGESDAVVDEIVQDVLLEAWRKLPTYEAVARFRAFLWGIAAFKCANVRRKRHDVLTSDGFLEEAAGDRSALARLADGERDELVAEAAAAVLDDADQEIVHLRWVMDYPLDDIAQRLGLADDNAVRVALQRSKRRLGKEVQRRLAARGLGDSFLRGSGV